MAYTRIDWQDGEQGGTPVSAANLNHMDQGIEGVDLALTAHKSSADHDGRYYTKSQTDALVDPIQPDSIVYMSGNAGASDSVGGNQDVTLQQFFVKIPAGKRLVLTRARFSVSGLLLRLFVEPLVLSGSRWQADSASDEVAPNMTIYSNGGGSEASGNFKVGVRNVDNSTQPLNRHTGWSLVFAITD